MDYSNQSIGALLRGPLLTTTQGHIVLLTLPCYLVLAVLFAVGAVSPPLGKSIDSVVTFCVVWPFIVFLMFIKNGLPSFKPSVSGSLFLVVAALMPVAFVVWKQVEAA